MPTIDQNDGKYSEVTTFPEMIGRTCMVLEGKVEAEQLKFIMRDGSVFTFWHSQDCCENVRIEEVVGDLDDLVGAPLLEAEEVDSSAAPNPGGDSHTWTFYKFRTFKGAVTVRFLGTSNGYYSEGVSYSHELQPRQHDITNIPLSFEVLTPEEAAKAEAENVQALGEALDELEK